MEVNLRIPHAYDERLKSLEFRVYNSVFITTMTSGFTHSYSPTMHKLCVVRNVRVTNPQGENVSVALTVYPNHTVQIDSNIDLAGSTLMIY